MSVTPKNKTALELFDKCKSTLLNGSVQSYLIPLQHVDTIRASLTPHPPAWQEIGSAPRDGTSVLVTNRDETWVSSFRAHFVSCDMTSQPARWTTLGRCDIEQPTHWLPLPHPPTEGEKK